MTRQQFEELKAEARELHGRTVTFRRAIHEHPELSFAEHETARYVSGQLAAEGISFRPIAGTGILAKIEGRGDLSRCVVLRADMDALPIREQTGLPFASRNEGGMHACGHDMHTACLLGALILLNRRRSEIDGTVFGLFQPGEEVDPGGASLVLAEDPFRDYRVQAVVGEHVGAEIPLGQLGFRPDKYMASGDEVRITVRGRGGHGAGRPRRRRIRTQCGNGFHRLSGRGAFRREGISLLRRPGSGAESDHRSRTETCSGASKVKNLCFNGWS